VAAEAVVVDHVARFFAHVGNINGIIVFIDNQSGKQGFPRHGFFRTPVFRLISLILP
jgi:hypothetical protein